MKVLRALLGCAALGCALLWVPPQGARTSAATLGPGERGAGASIRERVEFVFRSENPAHANAMLAELWTRRGSAADPLEAETIDGLARDVIRVRNERAVGRLRLADRYRSFLGSIADGASWSDWAYGVPASITMAQAILESGWGKAAPGHNYFGMMGDGPAGHTVITSVDYRGGKRRVLARRLKAFESPAQAMEAHGRLLGTSHRYTDARAHATDPATFARRLQGTYASDPRYAARLMEIVDGCGLVAFDVEQPTAWDPTSG